MFIDFLHSAPRDKTEPGHLKTLMVKNKEGFAYLGDGLPKHQKSDRNEKDTTNKSQEVTKSKAEEQYS